MTCTILAGGQFGDEGKGKIISHLALNDKPDIIARAGVGPNAGHTIVYEGKKYALRQLPCGFVQKNAKLYIGTGVLIDPAVLLEEIEKTETKGRIFIDKRCAIISEEHRKMDTVPELKGKIGTTGTGCGPANADRAYRKIKLASDVSELKEYLADVPLELNKALDEKKNILVEGTQGALLSLYYGYIYPYVTSKDTTASSFAADIGVGPRRINDIIVVFKSYPSRVGKGPFRTKISEEEAEKLGIEEFGTVTGRRRSTGKFDFELARYACMLNSASQVALTCVDYIDRSITNSTEFSQLTPKVRDFIDNVEKELQLPVTLISTGPDTEAVIDLREEKL